MKSADFKIKKTTKVSFRAEAELKLKLYQLAAKYNLDPSEYMRRVFIQHISEKEFNNEI
jgi:antitoxin component of RelBE/YafQ-DinJ toxin-antitoxin module